MPQVGSFSRSSDMFAALRRTKSLPIWLAAIAALTVLVTLSTIVVNSLIHSQRTQDGAASELARTESAQALARMKARTPGELAVPSARLNKKAAPADEASAAVLNDAIAQQPADAVALAQTTDDTGTSSAAGAEAHHAHVVRAPHRRVDPSRDNGSLRADIARYNAERGTDGGQNHMLQLRAASVPSGHSLWDEVPQPLSDIYRN